MGEKAKGEMKAKFTSSDIAEETKDLNILYKKRNAAKKTKKDADAHVITAEKEVNDKEHAKDVAQSFYDASQDADDHSALVQAVHDATDAQKAYEKAQKDARGVAERLERFE